MPQEWETYGAWLGDDGLLYLAEWRQGFTVHELRAMFFECQQIRGLESQNLQLRREIDGLYEKIHELQKQRAFYRNQCHSVTDLDHKHRASRIIQIADHAPVTDAIAPRTRVALTIDESFATRRGSSVTRVSKKLRIRAFTGRGRAAFGLLP